MTFFPGVLRLKTDDTEYIDAWPCSPVNRWRELAKGRRVHSAPLWLYCDDTSGNVSKKWNKHNSVLFTLAGLPRTSAQLLYNVHFLETSNIAPPLEMMEAFVESLKSVIFTKSDLLEC